MQRIKFLRYFVTKGLEIHSSFYRIFQFLKKIKFKMVKFENFQNSKFFKNGKLTEF
jgi:hypothetical protein